MEDKRQPRTPHLAVRMATYNVFFSENPYFTYNMHAKPMQGILRPPSRCSSSGCLGSPRSQPDRHVTFIRHKAVRPGFHFDDPRQRRSASSGEMVRVGHAAPPVQPKRTEDHIRSRHRKRNHFPTPKQKKSPLLALIDAEQQPSSSSHGSKSAPALKTWRDPRELVTASTENQNSSREGKGDRRSSSRRRDEADRKRDAEQVGEKKKHRSSGKSRCHCKKCAKLAEERQVEGKHAERTGRRSSAARCKRSKS
ncbi:hypothetical protein FGB62_65g03 [Gracilaria domingensis]|nr:hypothetical protein FGB62_65g03 [Gracilaria domingensis]